MRAALNIDLRFEQILSLVRQLPKKEKVKRTKELEKEGIESKLSELLKIFKTDELSLNTINKEVELVRQHIYEDQKY